MEDISYPSGEENSFTPLCGDENSKAIDLLGSLAAHASADSTVTLQPTSILKLSQRENKPRVDVDKRKVTFSDNLTACGRNSEESRWRMIRELDELENWTERNQVVTKGDHVINCESSRVILLELLENLPCFVKENAMADECPENDVSEEEFRPATEVFASGESSDFELEFLESLGSNVDPAAIALARQSLYVKFDPLVKGVSPVELAPSVLPSVSFKEGNDLLQLDTPEKKQGVVKQTNMTQLKSKEPVLLVVPDQVVSDMKESSSLTHTSSLIDSSQLSEPSTAPSVDESLKGVDRLLFCSPSLTPENNSPSISEGKNLVGEDSELVDVLMYTQQDIDEKVRLAVQECQRQVEQEIAMVEQEIAMLQSTVTQKEDELVRLKKECADMHHVVDDYQRLLSEHRESSEEKMSTLTEARRERDQALADFNSVETAFTEQHKRYEKLKVLYNKAKKECADTSALVGEYRDKLARSEQKYKSVKTQAEEKIASANAEIEKQNKLKASEVSSLQSNLKKEGVRVAALERQLQQKTKEAQELSSICEDLMKAMDRNQ